MRQPEEGICGGGAVSHDEIAPVDAESSAEKMPLIARKNRGGLERIAAEIRRP